MSSTVDIVQTAVLVVTALASMYAVAAAELGRRLDNERARVERVFDAVLALAEAAITTQEISGQGAQFLIARRRLRAVLEVVGIRGYEHTELMTRETMSAAEVSSQSEQAILEVCARLDEVAPRPLWKRRPHVDFRERATLARGSQ